VTRNQLAGVNPTLPVLDYDNNRTPYKKVPHTKTPPPIHPHHDPPPMMFNNYSGMPPTDPHLMSGPNVFRNQSPHYDLPAQVIYENDGINAPYRGRRGSDASYDQPIEMEFPPKPDSSNSNSTYSELSYYVATSPYSPQNQYPYQQQIPPPNNQYGYVVDQNVPRSNQYVPQFNQYYEETGYYNEPYSQPSQPPQPPYSPQNTQFVPIEGARQQITNAIPPPQRNNSNALSARHQQNPSSRPYNNYPIQGGKRL